MSTPTAAAIPDLQPRLDEMARHYRVPGAALAILAGDESAECATGVLSRNTGVETTVDSVFQIGSITKTFTTALIMQLVDEGRLELDAPVRVYLPGLHLADAYAAGAITVRQLLTHTSGIDGDFFHDTGRGDDCVERYVLSLAGLPQLHMPGQMWSYCNAGFVVAGRIIERLTGRTWDEALKERLVGPLGMSAMGTLPEEAIMHRAASGHLPAEGGEMTVAQSWSLPRSNGPAGATPFATARDLLTWARLHMDEGRSATGSQVLSAQSVRAMQERQVTIPHAGDPAGWGLGWMLFDWPGGPVFGHDGGTIGQSSFLRVAPRERVAVALVSNGGNAQALYRKLFTEIFDTLAGVTVPPLPEPVEGVDVEPGRYAGVYEKFSARMAVEVRDGQLVATTYPLHALSNADRPTEAGLFPIDDANFLSIPREGGLKTVVTFLAPGDGGHPTYVLGGSRLFRRT